MTVKTKRIRKLQQRNSPKNIMLYVKHIISLLHMYILYLPVENVHINNI